MKGICRCLRRDRGNGRKISSQGSRSGGWYLSPGTLEQGSGVLSTRSRCWLRRWLQTWLKMEARCTSETMVMQKLHDYYPENRLVSTMQQIYEHKANVRRKTSLKSLDIMHPPPPPLRCTFVHVFVYTFFLYLISLFLSLILFLIVYFFFVLFFLLNTVPLPKSYSSRKSFSKYTTPKRQSCCSRHWLLSQNF